jgi:hypothetical protein
VGGRRRGFFLVPEGRDGRDWKSFATNGYTVLPVAIWRWVI